MWFVEFDNDNYSTVQLKKENGKKENRFI